MKNILKTNSWKLLLLALISHFNCSGQPETKEDFVNQIFHTVFAVSKSYYLCDRAENISFIDTTDLYAMRKIEPNTLSGLFKNMRPENPDTFWNFSRLINAKPFNSDSSNIISVFENVTIVKKGWSEARISRQERKQSNRRLRKIKRMGGALYYFSAPVFDDLHQYAVISLRYHCGSLCGGECLYLFKKVSGQWENIGETRCWVS